VDGVDAPDNVDPSERTRLGTAPRPCCLYHLFRPPCRDERQCRSGTDRRLRRERRNFLQEKDLQ